MIRPKRKTLSVTQKPAGEHQGLNDENGQDEERKLVIETIELALPCRHFLVEYKVASSEKFSPTLEFLLRLVYSAAGIEREQVSAFFGYNEEETDFVIREATVHGFVNETDSRLRLTIAGRDLFEKSTDGPRLFSVRKRTDKVAFDLLSLAPTRQKHIAVKSLPELPISSEAASKGVTKEIQMSKLRRFFGELGLSRARDGEAPSTLYSVDRVQADRRFLETIPVSIVANVSSPSNVVADLSEWRPDHEITDRMEIEREVSRFVDSMKILSRSGDGDEAYDVLSQLFPEYLDKFSTRKGLNVERFWREVSLQDPSPRINRKTVPVVGSLFTKRNSKNIGEVIEYGAKNLGDALSAASIQFLWVAPQIPTWGASHIARTTNDLIKAKIAKAAGREADSEDVSNLCLFPGTHPFHLRDVFDFVKDVKDEWFPKELELLYVPGILVAASVRAPIMLNHGFPTPLGVMSFDTVCLERTQRFLESELRHSGETSIEDFLRASKRISALAI